MEQPPGFVPQGESGKVCRLHEAIYGLKQSPKTWFGKFSDVVLKFGLRRCHSNHFVFSHTSDRGKILLIVYVDDIIITGDDKQGIDDLKIYLQNSFQTKDLGKLRYFLGIEVARSKEGTSLSQGEYVLDILEETGLLGSKPMETPMDPNVKLYEDQGELLSNLERYRLVGKLNYLTITRLNISFEVSVLSQFMKDPRLPHQEAVIRIVRYPKAHPSRGLLYKANGHLWVEAYTDADWAGSPSDRKSTTEDCTFLGRNLITWRSKKQTEAEYGAMAHTSCEFMWIKHLLEELRFVVKLPMTMHCDNQVAIYIASNPVFYERTKHIEVNCHITREKVEDSIIATTYVSTRVQIVDMFTKVLCKTRLGLLCNKLGLYDIYSLA